MEVDQIVIFGGGLETGFALLGHRSLASALDHRDAQSV